MSEALRLALDAFGDSSLDIVLEDVVRERAHQEKKFPDQKPEIGVLGSAWDRDRVVAIKAMVDSKLAAKRLSTGPGPTLRDILEEEMAELMACDTTDLDAQYDELIDVMASCALWAQKIVGMRGQQTHTGYLAKRGLAHGERNPGSTTWVSPQRAPDARHGDGLSIRHG